MSQIGPWTYLPITRTGFTPNQLWRTAMVPTVAAGEVEVQLSRLVSKPVPEDVSIEGVELRTGTLPDRTEAFVRVDTKDVEEDLLDDTSGGRLLHPSYL